MKKVGKKAAAVCMSAVLLAGSFASNAQAKLNGYYFKNKGVSVTMDSAAKKFISKAGKAEKTVVKKSCAYKGMDRTYQYKNFILYTYSNSDKGAEYVQRIVLRNSSVSTGEGLKIGDAESEVVEKYGKSKPSFGIYTYLKGNTKIQFEIKKGKVKNIQYFANK